MTEAELPRDLKWRCRRGMRELDTLLARWLETCWLDASEDLRDAFRILLQTEDDQLWDWLAGRSRPETGALREIVDDIRLATTKSD